MFSNISEWLVVLLVVVVLFGAGKIPKLSEDLGKAVSSFKKGLKEGKKELEKDEDDKEEK